MSTHPALRNLRRVLTLFIAVVAAGTLVFTAAKPAQWPPPMSAEEVDLQRQVREIAVTLRAPCCPTLNVAQHDSPVTLEMKRRIREMILDGKSRREIVSALAAKYGDGIVPKASIAGMDLVLYLGVPGLALALIWAVWWHLRGRRRPEVLHLADDRWNKGGKKAA